VCAGAGSHIPIIPFHRTNLPGRRFEPYLSEASGNLGAGLFDQAGTKLGRRTYPMQECPQCGKLFDPVPTSGDFCQECSDVIRDDFGLPAMLRRAWIRLSEPARWLRSIKSRQKEHQHEDASTAKESRTKIVLSFAVHQFIGTWGVGVTVPWLVFFAGDFLRLFGKGFPMRDSHWILTETGYFPLQIAFALFLGWLLGRDLRRRSMLWVWVIPFVILCYALAAIPTITPFLTTSAMQAGIGQPRLWHYFASGCRAEYRCLDQVIFTMPFYASVAYSIGALLAPRMPSDSQTATTIRFWAGLTIGLVYLSEATVLLVQAKKVQSLLRQSVPNGFGGASRWLALASYLVPVAVGGCLIYFADWLRRTKEIHPVADSRVGPLQS
jgi:hypothetical protein